MAPIRILHMIGSMDIGGSQTMILNLYRNIDRNIIQFDFVLDHPSERALAEQFEALGARIYSMPSFYFSNIAEIKSAWHRFFRENPEYKILHSHVRSYASIYIPIAKKYGVKTIIHSHSTSNGTGVKSLLKAILQYPLRYQADYFFSCSEEAGRWLFGDKVVSGNRHTILRNSIDAAKYRYNENTRKEYRKMLKLGDKIAYAHVGRFHPSKNHDFLLRIFRKIRDEQENALLVLIGDGELRADIEKYIADLNLEESVILLGNRHDIPELLQAMDVFLFPSAWEGLGIVAVEAQAVGLPCICSDQVPQLVKVTDDCLFLPLEESKWVAAVQRISPIREDCYERIVASGYDVNSTAQWLQQFYLNALEVE